MNPLLAQFLSEAADLLVVLDEGLLQLERDPENAELVNEVFRAAHTIKGSSGLFDFPELTRLVHAAEDLLDAVRGGRIGLESTMTDDLLAVFDVVRTWLEQVGATERLPVTAAAEAAELIVRLKAPLGIVDGAAPAVSTTVSGLQVAGVAPPWVRLLGEDWLRATASWLSTTGARLRFAHYQPAADCFYQGEDPLYLVRQVPGLDRLMPVPPASWPSVDEYDEYACLLSFVIVTRAEVGELSHLFRYVPEQMEIVELDADGLQALLNRVDDAATDAGADGEPLTRDGTPEPDQDSVDDAHGLLRAALSSLHSTGGSGAAGGSGEEDAPKARSPHTLASIVRVSLAAAHALGRPIELAASAPPAEIETAIRTLLGAHVGPKPESSQPTIPATDTADDPPEASAYRAVAAAIPTTTDAGLETGRLGSRTLRVDHEKVDRLMELVGELHVAKNALAFLAEAAEEEFGSRVLSRRIKDQFSVQHRLVEELQAGVMDIRMLPLSVAFARFTRLVRDLGRKLDKTVDLVTEGGDTMADKDVIEALGDPLMHLVRNCVDHGLEPAVDRLAAGKPEHGTVVLSAVSEGDAVVVEVADDGRGIDPDKVRLSAYKKGLITEEDLESLNDSEAVDLVFRPGFSTAETISDVSGRGVGMDAVRASAERLGGTVTLRSRPGAGTVARLRMPLSMAVTHVMVISVAGQRFGVPIDAVVETVRIPTNDINRVLHQDVIVLRDKVLPLIDLAAALRMERVHGAPAGVDDDRRVLVIRVGDEQMGLLVEGFNREVEVLLKPMDGMLAEHCVFLGTALLGDGLVLLVLNPKEVLGLAVATA